MGQKWNECRILCCDAVTLAQTLPKGLKGRPRCYLDGACLELHVKVPSRPHPKRDMFRTWCTEQGVPISMVEGL